MKAFVQFVSRNFFYRFTLLSLAYSFALSLTFWVAYQLRFDFFVNEPDKYLIYTGQFQKALPFVLVLKLAFLAFFGQFSRLISYFSIPDLFKVHISVGGPSILLFFATFFLTSSQALLPPRGVLLIDFVLSFGIVIFIRLGLRILRERSSSVTNGSSAKSSKKRVAIIGAGDTGSQLITELLGKSNSGMEPIALFDDDTSKWKTQLHGVPVMGCPSLVPDLEQQLQLETVILAIPSASSKRIRNLVKHLNKGSYDLVTVPSLNQLASGSVQINQLRNVDIEDLLQRPSIALDLNNIRKVIRDKRCLVTGAGGSIGSELCRQILQYHPEHLFLLEQSEVQMFQIEQELLDGGYKNTTSLICDILDEQRMEKIFQDQKPDVVFHAAAHKHVPLMESQPSEAIKNNSWGTSVVAKLSMRHKVDRFVLISTDKAINPTNVMGASKRAAEIFVQALNNDPSNQTRFVAVRFGNVLGSSGSVIPTFRKQIAQGGPVKVTHPEVTRYFMTIPEACTLVLEAGSIGLGGEIFVLDMGEPIKIMDLAEQLISLSGFTPGSDIEIEITGLRPGEKLFEELQHEGENMATTQHPKIMRFLSESKNLEDAERMILSLMSVAENESSERIKMDLKRFIPEYKPFLK